MNAQWYFLAAALLATFSFCVAMQQLRSGLILVLCILFLVLVPLGLTLVVSAAAQFGGVF